MLVALGFSHQASSPGQRWLPQKICKKFFGRVRWWCQIDRSEGFVLAHARFPGVRYPYPHPFDFIHGVWLKVPFYLVGFFVGRRGQGQEGLSASKQSITLPACYLSAGFPPLASCFSMIPTSRTSDFVSEEGSSGSSTIFASTAYARA